MERKDVKFTYPFLLLSSLLLGAFYLCLVSVSVSGVWYYFIRPLRTALRIHRGTYTVKVSIYLTLLQSATNGRKVSNTLKQKKKGANPLTVQDARATHNPANQQLVSNKPLPGGNTARCSWEGIRCLETCVLLRPGLL